MIYSLLDDIFQHQNDQNIDLLDKIWLNSKGRHFLYINTNQNFEVIKSSDWYCHLRRSSKDQIELDFVDSFNSGKKKNKLVISNDNIGNNFSLLESFEILNKPLTIILENIEYDRYFIDSLILNFKELSNEIKNHYDKGWLVYTNGGGNNITNVINVMRDRFDKNKSDYPKDASVYLRTFIIIDSDKRFPSENEVADDKKNLLTLIKTNSNYHITSNYHVTSKREMENYLPDEILSEISNNQEFKRAYLTLTSEQKDFFDIENGLADKNFNDLEEGVKLLFGTVEEEYKKIFRKERLKFYKEDNKKDSFKARFAKLFESKNITRKNLEARANTKELEIILQKINNLL